MMYNFSYSEWILYCMYAIKLLIISLLAGLISSCATPPSKPETSSALDLAGEYLQPSTTTLPVQEEAIVALPANRPAQLREINQIGSLPTVRSSPEPQPEFTLQTGQPLTFNFEQVPLRDVVQILADTMGISIVVDTSIGTEKITMRTAEGKDLAKRDLWPLLQLILSESGITMEKRGNLYYLKKIGVGGLPGRIGMNLSDSSDPSAQILQITPLRYIGVESASAAITPMIQPNGRILNLANLNIIGIVSTPTIMERINKLLAIIDADPFAHRGIRLFRLQHAEATEVKTELDQILQAIMGAAPAYQVIALERINAILVVAPPRGGFTDVEMWVEVLDERHDANLEQIFIYRVKNLEANDLASTLSSVFEQKDKSEEEKRREPEDDTTLPQNLPLQMADNAAAIARERGDTRTQQAIVSADLRVNIVADEKTNSLLIRATARDYQQLLETIRILDRVPLEVMVNVVIAEVTLSESTKYGIDWTALINKFGPSADGSIRQSSIGTAFGVTSGSGLVLNYFSGDVTALLNLVESDGNVTLLSRPSILVRNNEEALINVGSNEPVITRVNSSAVTPGIGNTAGYFTNEVQYRDTGITLKVTPRINDDGIINMKVYQEVSQLGEERTEQRLQSFLQRKIETNVVVRDGTAIVIGGLIEDTGNYSNSGLPVLRKTQVGGLFSSTSKSTARTELVLIIVPQIVNPELNNDPLLHRFISQMQSVSNLLAEHEIYTKLFLTQ
jgi:general secretion pathway protein D